MDPNLAINSIKDGIKELNNSLGINIKKVIVNIPDYNAKFMFVTGEVDIIDEEPDIKEMNEDDYTKLVEKCIDEMGDN